MIETQVKPPPCNTGANPLLGSLVWDWYQATVMPSTEAVTCADVIMRALGSASLTFMPAGRRWKAVRGLYGYSEGMTLEGLVVGSVGVFWGVNAGVHVQGTGPAAVFVASVLRQWWPDHAVSRADVAFDVDSVGSFDRLYKRVHLLARDGAAVGGRKIGTSTEGDWLDGERGRTFYAGGRTSRLRVRVYEKGHEQRSKDPNCSASLDWTRVEWQLRPSSDQKRWLGTATPLDALGLSPFGACVAAAVLGENVESVGGTLRFASQDPGYWMVHQYRGVVVDLLALDPDDMRRRLVELLDRNDGQRSVNDGKWAESIRLGLVKV